MKQTNDNVNILIVDDTPQNIQVAASILNNEGYRLSFATDGKSALEQAKSEKFDLILLDIMMTGMDGYEVCKHLKNNPQTSDIPIIFLTARTDTESIIKGFQMGGGDYVTKPFNAEELLARVKTHLKLRQAIKELKYAYEEVELTVQIRTEELRKAMTALIESEKRYRTLVENLPLGVYRNTPQGQFIAVNPAMVEMTGFDSPQELMNVNIVDLYDDPSVRTNILEILHKKGILTSYEIQFKRKNGSKFWAAISAAKIADTNGNFQYIDGIIKDISGRKQAEEENRKLELQLRQTQKLEAIGTLAAGIAHDFNNVLFALIGFTELSMMNLEEGKNIKGHLDKIMKGLDRAKNLVRQILVFSRKAVIHREPIMISPIIKETLKFLRASILPIIEIREKIMIFNEMVMGDPTQIHQILMNLCTNAAHAMKEKGGVLDVKLESIEIENEKVLELKNLKPGHYIRLSVTDTGHGISKENMERIFDPFFTTKERGEGTGLGLSIVHGIIKEMQGAISVYSEVGKGATFNVYLPIVEKNISAKQSNTMPEIRNNRILFVDDEEIIIEAGGGILKQLGYAVVTAANGFDAVNIFKQNPEAFDLVITDLVMPKMTGLELAKQLIAIRPNIPIVLCSGFSNGITPEIMKDTGIRELIMKPITTRELVEAINKALRF